MRARPLLFPHAAQLAYTRALVGLVDDVRRWILGQVMPRLPRVLDEARALRGDSVFDDFDAFMGKLRENLPAVVPKARVNDIAGTQVRLVNAHNRTQVARQFKQALGVDIFQTEPWLQPHVEAAVAENVSLIESIAPKMLDDVEQTVLRAARTGQRVEQTAKQLEDRFDVSRSRARLIARDQTNKLNGEFTELRHREAGVDEYDWDTSQDERVRPDHARLQGKTFAYSKPPIVDTRTGRRANPGQDYQCRCNALPNFDKLEAHLDELFARGLPAGARTR